MKSKKKNKFDKFIIKFSNFLGMYDLFNVGEIIFDLVLTTMAIKFLVEFWLSFPINFIIINLGFAFAIVSLTLRISIKYLHKIFGVLEEKKK